MFFVLNMPFLCGVQNIEHVLCFDFKSIAMWEILVEHSPLIQNLIKECIDAWHLILSASSQGWNPIDPILEPTEVQNCPSTVTKSPTDTWFSYAVSIAYKIRSSLFIICTHNGRLMNAGITQRWQTHTKGMCFLYMHTKWIARLYSLLVMCVFKSGIIKSAYLIEIP